MPEDIFYIWLSLACGVGSPVSQKLLLEFGNAENIYKADDFFKYEIEEHIKFKLLDKDLSECERIYEWCEKNGVGLLNCDSELYPKRLRNTRAFPVILYYRGRLPEPDFNDNLCVTMVGTRKASDYGAHVAYDLAFELAKCGVIIVSGMALGIDVSAQKGCLYAGGYTIAVFGCGIDIVYPKDNKAVMDKIIETGIVMTEFCPGTPPIGKNFPVRNRIMSGLSQAVVVVEADKGSGALITAKTALFQGRELYAVPGNINNKNSGGTNDLLKNQAGLVTCAYDILSEYEYLYSHRINVENCKYYNKDYVKKSESINNSNSNNKKEIEKYVKEKTGPVAKMGERIRETSENNINNNVNNVNNNAQNTKKAELSLAQKLAATKIILNESEMKVFVIFYYSETGKLRSDDIKAENMSISEVINTLTFLEIYGIITPMPGDFYKITEAFMNL